MLISTPTHLHFRTSNKQYWKDILTQNFLFKKRHDKQDLSNILSSIFISLQILGVTNCSSIIPVVVTERTVLYREMFSGMYSSWAYSLAQVTIN